jgi:hypothetical protein
MCAWELKNIKNPQDVDLLIAIPHTGLVRMDWAFSLKHLDMPPGVMFATMGLQGQPIHLARNQFITSALQRNAEHIFFLDADVEMPHDGLVKLYETKRPIIAGVYSQRSPPYALSANIQRRALTPEILEKYPNAVLDVHEIGMGCALINMRVIKRIAARQELQWYCMKPHGQDLGIKLRPDEISEKEVMVYTNKEATELQWRCRICNSGIVADFFKYTIGTGLSAVHGMFSEDYYFCYQARQVGFPIFIHTGVFTNHELFGMKITREGLLNPVAPANEI